MQARVHVTLKSGVLDPQGKAVGKALAALGFDGVEDVRQGRFFELRIAGTDPDVVRRHVESMCDKLLANTAIETYSVEIAG